MAKVSAEIEVTSTGDGFAQATGQAKQFRGAMSDLGTSGARAMEQMQDRVFDLQSALIAQRKQLLSVREAQAQLNVEMNKAGGGTLAQGAALKKLNIEEAQLQKNLTLSSAGYKNAQQELGNLSARSRDAFGDASQLAAMMGVRLPYALGGMIAKSAGVQKALSAIIPVGLIVGGAAAAGYAIAELYVKAKFAYDDYQRAVTSGGSLWGAITGQNAVILEAVDEEAAKTAARGAQALAQVRSLQAEARLLGISPSDITARAKLQAQLSQAAEQNRTALEEAARQYGPREGLSLVQEAINQKYQATVAAMEKDYYTQRAGAYREYALGVEKQAGDLRRSWMGEVEALDQAAKDEIALREKQIDREKFFGEEEKKLIQGRADFAIAQRYRQMQAEMAALEIENRAAMAPSQRVSESITITGQVAAYRRSKEGPFGQLTATDEAFVRDYEAALRARSAYKWSERDRATRIETIGIQEQAGVAALPAWMRPMGQIAAEERRQLRELDELRRGDLIGAEDYERRRAAYTIMAEQQRIEAVRSFGRELESMYDRTIGSAKSAGEAVANIWHEAMSYVKRQFFDAIAAMILGRPGSAGVSPAGPGLGGIFGGILGIGASGLGGTTGMIQNAFPGGGGGSTGGWGAGMGLYDELGIGGWGSPGLSSPTTSSAAASGAGLAGILGGLGGLLRGPTGKMLGIGGMIMGATAGHGRILGGIGGYIGGGLMGGALASLLGLAALGPIGAAAGALIGIFGPGLFGRGKKKSDASAIADQGFAEIFRQIDDYKSWRRDFASTLAAMNTTWGGMRDQWRGIWGGYGNSSERDQRQWYDAAVAQVTGIEQARQSRRAVLGGGLAPTLPLPEFQSGGYVSGAPGQPQLIVAHGGERVQTPAQAWSSPEEPAPVTATPATAGQIIKVLIRDPKILDDGMLFWLQRRGRAARAVMQ